MQLPNIKENPVLMSVLVMAFLVIYGLVAMAGGWTLRMALESRAELSVVLDDSEFMQGLEIKINKWIDEFTSTQENFYDDNPEIPDCIAKPMPEFYRDNDFGLQRSLREQEE